jgi:hypothetical protein
MRELQREQNTLVSRTHCLETETSPVTSPSVTPSAPAPSPLLGQFGGGSSLAPISGSRAPISDRGPRSSLAQRDAATGALGIADIVSSRAVGEQGLRLRARATPLVRAAANASHRLRESAVSKGTGPRRAVTGQRRGSAASRRGSAVSAAQATTRSTTPTRTRMRGSTRARLSRSPTTPAGGSGSAAVNAESSS